MLESGYRKMTEKEQSRAGTCQEGPGLKSSRGERLVGGAGGRSRRETLETVYL